jgi:hypothetical protein
VRATEPSSSMSEPLAEPNRRTAVKTQTKRKKFVRKVRMAGSAAHGSSKTTEARRTKEQPDDEERSKEPRSLQARTRDEYEKIVTICVSADRYTLIEKQKRRWEMRPKSKYWEGRLKGVTHVRFARGRRGKDKRHTFLHAGERRPKLVRAGKSQA